MSMDAASGKSLDAAALDWLDHLLDASRTERRHALEQLSRAEPLLGARVARLLAASDATDKTSLLGQPFAFDWAAGDATSGLQAGGLFAGYRLLRELGRGGMSTVWLAERADGVPRRQVALKVPLLTLGSSADRERFARERDVLASLNHPDIARLLDAGVSPGGQPFIVIEHVDGQTLPEACDSRGLGLRERLRLFLKVLAAVEHAHKHLVVHRDLKPSNILVNAQGEVKLLDFGIAKLLDGHRLALEDGHLTQAVGCAATPRYAAPEQLEGGTISTATDVYALGVVLFELLTGESPYGHEPQSLAQWIQAVLASTPARPSQVPLDAQAMAARSVSNASRWRAALAGDIDNIVLTALRKNPAERYGSVERFAEDVRRFIDHRPVRARRPSLAHRLRLFLRRHRTPAIAASLGLAVAAGFAGTAWRQHLNTQEERLRADTVRDFMFDLIDDAETDDAHAGAEPTGRQMVAGAVRRARENFKDQPRLRGELLAELGRMTRRLGADEDSVRLLREALALLSASAPEGDASLNKTRTSLADALLMQGQIDAAKDLAGMALSRCTQGQECAKARFYANTVLSNVHLRQGEPKAALAQAQEGVRNSEAGFGARHSETAIAMLALAVVARQAGDLALARSTLDRAIETSRELTLRLSDRVEMSRTRAVLSMDLGEYADAQRRLQDLLPQAPSRGERALIWRLLATVHLALGSAAPAEDAAAKAIELAAASPGDPELLFARQAHARALSLKGLARDAGDELQAVIQGLRDAGYPGPSMEVLRARRMHAETLARAGRRDEALAELRAVAQEQSVVQATQEIEYAQTLDLTGCVLRDLGLVDEALASHRRAAALLEKKLPPDHPWRQRNTLYQEAVAASVHATPEAAADWARRALAYASRFPGDSQWRTLLDARGSHLRCTTTGSAACGLYL